MQKGINTGLHGKQCCQSLITLHLNLQEWHRHVKHSPQHQLQISSRLLSSLSSVCLINAEQVGVFVLKAQLTALLGPKFVFQNALHYITLCCLNCTIFPNFSRGFSHHDDCFLHNSACLTSLFPLLYCTAGSCGEPVFLNQSS